MGNLGYNIAYAVSLRRAGHLKWLIVASWFLVPVLAETIMHPTDAAGFWYWLNSLSLPQYYFWHEIVRGEFTTLLVLGAVIFIYLVAVTLFYRRAQFFVPLWPLAALLVGGLGNAAWFFGTGVWDSAGAMAGFMPAALAGLASVVCERLGADFVFGPGNRPAFDDVADY